MKQMTQIDIAKFWMKVRVCNKTKDQRYKQTYIGSCWIWTYSLAKSCYENFQWDGKRHRSHRIAYEIVYGQIPENKFVCHKCDNPSCVNPQHLFLGTSKENTHDMISKGRLNRSRGENKGVSYRKENGKWRARYMKNYKNILVGEFQTKEEALKALKSARKTP